MTERRIVRRPSTQADSALPASLHPVLRRVYAARGVRGPADIDLGLERLLPVSSLGGVPAAVELLMRCHRDGRRVLVVGDFDADGATSTALVVRQLRRLGFRDAGFLVPDRFRFGYGLTPEIVRVAARLEPDLIVTVDNGVSSVEGVAEARSHGIEVLVTDHHLPGPSLPEAAAIVNPNLAGEAFASKSLAGVGVAFYVMAALTRALRDRWIVARSRRRQSCRPARPRGARHGGGRGPARFQQSHPRRPGIAAYPCRSLRARPRSAARARRARSSRRLWPRTSGSRSDRDSTPPDGSRT